MFHLEHFSHTTLELAKTCPLALRFKLEGRQGDPQPHPDAVKGRQWELQVLATVRAILTGDIVPDTWELKPVHQMMEWLEGLGLYRDLTEYQRRVELSLYDRKYIGYVDLLFRVSAGKLDNETPGAVIVDIKSSQYPELAVGTRNIRQVVRYGLALEDEGIPPYAVAVLARGGFEHLLWENVDTYHASEDLLAEIQALETLLAIWNQDPDRLPDPQPSTFCKYCPYLQDCMEGKRFTEDLARQAQEAKAVIRGEAWLTKHKKRLLELVKEQGPIDAGPDTRIVPTEGFRTVILQGFEQATVQALAGYLGLDEPMAEEIVKYLKSLGWRPFTRAVEQAAKKEGMDWLANYIHKEPVIKGFRLEPKEEV